MDYSIPELKPVEISDLTVFNSLLKKYPPQISELTFTNLYMWRNFHQFMWARVDDWIVIRAVDRDGKPYFWGPVGGGNAKDIIGACFEHLAQSGVAEPRIERVPSAIAKEIESSDLVATPDRDQFDYVYKTSDLIALSGRDFHGKKNHLNKFRKTYSWTYEKIGPGTISECGDMQAKWCDLRQCHLNPGLAGEERAILDALENIKSLQFAGGIIRVDGRIEAFALGERLNNDTAVIHVEKANPDIDGLYTAINQAFVENELSSFVFINREQDLGIPGLRKAKQSYNPIKMIEKFRVMQKD